MAVGAKLAKSPSGAPFMPATAETGFTAVLGRLVVKVSSRQPPSLVAEPKCIADANLPGERQKAGVLTPFCPGFCFAICRS